jgi:hypothetical protein
MLGAMNTSILLFTRDDTGKKQNVILHMNEHPAVITLLVVETNQYHKNT